MERAPDPNESDKIEHRNQSAFDAIMRDFSPESRDWVLKRVNELGISMRSPHWLPAAITARLILDMKLTGTTVAKQNADTAEAVLKAINDAREQRRLHDEASRLADQRRSTQSEALLLNLQNSALQSSQNLETTFSAAVDRIVAAVATVAKNTAATSTKAIVGQAERQLGTTLLAFVRTQAIALSAVFTVGLAFGAFCMYWFDAAHLAAKVSGHHG